MQDCLDEIIPNNRQGGRDTNFTKGRELGDWINAEAQRDGRSAKGHWKQGEDGEWHNTIEPFME